MAYYGGARKRVFLLATNAWWPKLITNFLDSRPEILNWYAVLPSTFLVVSRHDATTLANIVREGQPSIWFILTELDPTKTNGFINQQVWDFINAPKSSGRWEPQD